MDGDTGDAYLHKVLFALYRVHAYSIILLCLKNITQYPGAHTIKIISQLEIRILLRHISA